MLVAADIGQALADSGDFGVIGGVDVVVAVAQEHHRHRGVPGRR
ncbi:MAG: hypothetical protein U0R78_05340 [Nocardioidaceae bacterium]